jgi:hypothetical protein
VIRVGALDLDALHGRAVGRGVGEILAAPGGRHFGEDQVDGVVVVDVDLEDLAVVTVQRVVAALPVRGVVGGRARVRGVRIDVEGRDALVRRRGVVRLVGLDVGGVGAGQPEREQTRQDEEDAERTPDRPLVYRSLSHD